VLVAEGAVVATAAVTAELDAAGALAEAGTGVTKGPVGAVGAASSGAGRVAVTRCVDALPAGAPARGSLAVTAR
jgi:hypothetical protein